MFTFQVTEGNHANREVYVKYDEQNEYRCPRQHDSCWVTMVVSILDRSGTEKTNLNWLATIVNWFKRKAMEIMSQHEIRSPLGLYISGQNSTANSSSRYN